MDSDGALQSMATLTLADLDDDDGIQQVGNVSLGPLGDVSEFYVVGCLVTDKPIKFMFFRDTMASVWRLAMTMNIKELSTKRHLFRFYLESDISSIMEDGP